MILTLCCLVALFGIIQADQLQNEYKYNDILSSDFTVSQERPTCPTEINCRTCLSYPECNKCLKIKDLCSSYALLRPPSPYSQEESFWGDLGKIITNTAEKAAEKAAKEAADIALQETRRALGF